MLFTLVAVVFTWPLAANLTGVPAGDAFVFTHCFWLYKKALVAFQNPFFTNYIFYPEGVNLAFQSGTFGNFLLTLPVTLLAGPAAGVNVSYLMTLVLAAWFTHLLVYRITGDLLASLAAAFIYSFSFMHTGHGVGHLNISSFHCLPAVLYALYRTFAARSWRWPVVAGIFCGLTVLTDQLHTILVAGACTAVFFWCLRNRLLLALPIRGILLRFTLIAVIGLAIASPYLVALFSFMGRGSAPLEQGIFDRGGANVFAADLLGFVMHPAGYGIFAKQFRELFPGFGNPQPFLGVVVMLLLLWQALSRRGGTLVKCLWISAGITFVLSLGPTLHIGGRWQWGSDGSFIRLPYFYFAKLPLFAQIRTPDRFHIATSFAVALLVAFALISLRKYLADRVTEKSAKIIVAGIMLLMAAEYLPPAGVAHQVPDSKVLRMIGKEPDNAPLLWLPLSRSSSFARNGMESSIKAMYYQTIHEKPILNGLISRVSSEQLEFNHPVLDMLVEAGNLDRQRVAGGTPIFEPGELDQVCSDAMRKRPLWSELRKAYGFRHIVVQKPFDQPGWATSKYVECLTGQSLVEELQGGISSINLRQGEQTWK